MEQAIGGGPKNQFEQVMQTCGYKFKETVQIADRQIQVYEKPQNSQYAVMVAQPANSLQKDIHDLLKVLNLRLVLVDGFDKDHSARRDWAKKLETEYPASAAIYNTFKKENKLQGNNISSIYAILETLTEIKDQKLKLKFEMLFKKFMNFKGSKKFNDLSLEEKVLYMEEIDKMTMQIIDLLRKAEQGESSLKT